MIDFLSRLRRHWGKVLFLVVTLFGSVLLLCRAWLEIGAGKLSGGGYISILSGLAGLVATYLLFSWVREEWRPCGSGMNHDDGAETLTPDPPEFYG